MWVSGIVWDEEIEMFFVTTCDLISFSNRFQEVGTRKLYPDIYTRKMFEQ